MKKTEETLQKISNAFQNRTQKKPTDITTKIQLKKMVDEMEKEIGLLNHCIFVSFIKVIIYLSYYSIINISEDMMNVFTNIKNGHNVDIPDVKQKDNNLKYDKLLKEYELLKEKLESAMKELASEKEKKKIQTNVKLDDTKNIDLQNGR
jgi:hypothetical protein